MNNSGIKVQFQGDLRDLFALAALASIISSEADTDKSIVWTFDFRADWSYRQADAMLSAREAKP